MASLQASFHAWADEGVPVAEMTGAPLRGDLAAAPGPDRFITFFLLCLDPATGEIEYTNAGHNPGLLLRTQTARSEELAIARTAAGPLPRQALRVLRSSRSQPGGLLCLYTDGVTEANDPAASEFGMPQAEGVPGRAGRPDGRRDRVRSRARARGARRRASRFADDRTLVMVRRLLGRES